MQLWKNTALTSVAALLGLFLLPLAVAREPAEVPETGPCGCWTERLCGK